MRVALIGHKQIPGRSGGVEVVVEELAIRLANLGVDVTAYNRRSKEHPRLDSFEGVRLVDVPTFDNKKLNAVVYSYLATILAIIGRYDVIHYHALGPSASLWLAKLFRKSVVVTVHGLNYKTPKWKGIGAKYIKFGEALSMAMADEVIVLSRSMQEFFEQKYKRRCLYLPNGLSMPERPVDDSVLDRLFLRNRDYALCVSRLVPGKGLEILIDAWRRVKTECLLIVAGDAEYMDDFKKELYDRAGADERIKFVGFVEKPDLCALYSSARLFVFPSEAEGMPMSLLEAMWFDCPCLVSDIPENVEVVNDMGRTFRVGDVDDLIEKIEASMDDSAERLGTREHVRANHDWSRIVSETVKIYEGALR